MTDCDFQPICKTFQRMHKCPENCKEKAKLEKKALKSLREMNAPSIMSEPYH